VSGTEAERERSQIAGRAGVVALGTLTSRLLGLGRDMALAAYFPRTATDAWLIAWQIPNLLRQLLAEGAVQTAVMPVLSLIRERDGEAAAARFYRAFSGFFFFVLGMVSLLGVLFARPITLAFASGFAVRPEQLQLTCELTAWVFPYIFFMGAAALGMAALNTHRRFVVTSFAPGLLNISFLVACVALPPMLGARGKDAIFAMVIGGLAGGALQVVAQWPSLKAIGYLSWPSLELGHPGIKLCVQRLVPTLLGIGVYGIDVVVGRQMLSSLPEGAVSYFTYAMRLCDFSQGIFVMALSTATLPTLSTLVAKNELSEVTSTLAYSLRLSLFIGILATVASLCLAEPIVLTVFRHGHFSHTDAEETTSAFIAQGVGIFLVAGIRQLVIAFFALGKTKVPVLVAVIDIGIFVVVGLSLRGTLGHVGVSWGVTAARIVQFFLLASLLRRYLPPLPVAALLASASKHLVASCCGAVLALGGLWALHQFPTPAPLRALVDVVLGGLLFAGGFFPCAYWLKSEELATVLGPLQRRLRGRRVSP